MGGQGSRDAVTDDRETLEPASAERARPRRTLGLTILFHADPSRIGERAPLGQLRVGKPVAVSRKTPPFAPPTGGDGGPLDDPCISRRPFHLAREGAERVVIDPRDAALVVDGQALPAPRTLSATDLERGVVVELADRVVLLLSWLGPAVAAGRDHGLVGANSAIEELRRDIERVADLDVPVMVRGETGTGKELVARALHQASSRAAGPFISVNLAAIPAATAASELFGHARGAFTGATAMHDGYFAQAEGGTLFLDEIGAAPAEVQPMLLRALESLEIQPLGSASTRRVDVRIVAATDADLERAIDEGSFRAAVYHRLEGYQLLLPPLRERRDDLGRLLLHFLREELAAIGQAEKLAPPAGADSPWLPAELAARLARLDWPGNVRQLRNVVRQLTISSRGLDHVRIDATLERLLAGATTPVDTPAHAGPVTLSDADLLRALRDHEFHVPAAAAALGISRSALYERMRDSPAIRQAKDLSADEIARAHARCAGDVTAMARALEVSARALALRIKTLSRTEP